METQISCRKANRFFQVVPITAALAICLFLMQEAPAGTATINLNTEKQTIRGFGGMNFPRWNHGLQNDAQVDTAFGNGPGQLGFTIMRIDVPPDNNDNHWSLALSAAQRAINTHGAIVFASPWTPPPSMKDNNSTYGGTQNTLKTGSYGAFANYLRDFANYFSSNGAPLYAISVQNEPDYSPGYESCVYSATQMQTFLNNNASVIPTRMIAPETTGLNSSYMNTVASSSECNVVACHIYGGNGYYSYPGKECWMTEHYTTSDPNTAILWSYALAVGKEIHDCMTNNMNAYIWWYIRRYYGPMDEDGSITKRGYCMSHFAKFARPGYVRVDATASPQTNVYVTAYTYDCNLVIVAINQDSSSQSVTFSLSGGSCSSYTKYETSSTNSLTNMGSVGGTDTLAANSINTYVGTVLYGDLNNDGKVDFIDFAILGQGWLTVYGWDTLADIADNWLYGT
jgi:glucuronoarabinoxylan endo-1,4-beta-xylanase